jgi:hypothetical protein
MEKRGFLVEISRDPDFKSVSFSVIQDYDCALEWLEDSKNFEETTFKVPIFRRLTEIEIDFCRDCEKPIKKGEVFCLRCEDFRNDAILESREYEEETEED